MTAKVRSDSRNHQRIKSHDAQSQRIGMYQRRIGIEWNCHIFYAKTDRMIKKQTRAMD